VQIRLRKTSEVEAYEEFVRRGNLEIVRRAIETVRVLVARELSQNDSGAEKAYLETYVNQMKFDTFIDSTLVFQWMKSESGDKNILKLPLPQKWITGIQEDIALRKLLLRQGKRQYYKKLLELQLRGVVRTIRLLFTHKSSNPGLEIAGENNLVVIGHTDHIIGSDSHTEGRWTYEAWSNKNTLDKRAISFLPELKFMQVLLANQFYGGRIQRIKDRVLLFARSMRRFINCKIKFFDRFIVLDQIFFSELILVANQAKIPTQIQFTESMGCRRPYWTYEAETRGVDIALRFFTNYATLSTKSRTEIPPQFSLYTWRKIFAVSDWQANSLPRFNALGVNVDIERGDIPWFLDDEEFKIPDATRFIVVFDYEPQKNHFGVSSINDLGLSNPECNLEFLETILEVCSIAKINCFHKRKRALSTNVQLVDYSQILARPRNRDFYKLVPENTSAHRIVSRALGVISLPPTSTGLIGRQMGVPSIYFDPTGNVLTDDPALDSVPLINSKEGLSAWIRSLESTS
jgi:hypothetical protein